jgi:hypothetical protein
MDDALNRFWQAADVENRRRPLRRRYSSAFRHQAIEYWQQRSWRRGRADDCGVVGYVGVGLQMRMSMRRFTRLTNGHRKKVENHEHALALHYVHYSFAWKQNALGMTPAMAAGLTNRAKSVEGIVGLLDAAEAKAA